MAQFVLLAVHLPTTYAPASPLLYWNSQLKDSLRAGSFGSTVARKPKRVTLVFLGFCA
jgi:hypothetical protein